MIKDLGTDDPDSVGPYRLLGRLGAGGMGQVYLGRSPGGRLVAIKVIRSEVAEDNEFRLRFAREVAAAREVSAMFTAAVVDADPEAETPWMATVYVPGPSLNEAVEAQGPLPVPTVLTLAAGLAEGLHAIHAAGLVHRDLKPSNVLLAHDGPRVIDFGISRATERSMLTQTGVVMGSPGFLSPEQAMGQVVDTPTDIFSLGAVLTFASTGYGPFGDGPTPTLMFRVVHQPPDLALAPLEIRPLLEACLAKEPEDRPTASQLLEMTGGADLAEGEWLPEPLTATLAKYAPTAVSPWTRSARISGPVTPARPASKASTVAREAAAAESAGTPSTRSTGVVSPEAVSAGTATSGPMPPVTGTGPIETAAAPSTPPKRRRRWRRVVSTVLVVVVLLVAGGLYGAWRYAQGQYYVGIQAGNVTIYRGIDQSIAGINLNNAVSRSDVRISQLSASSQASLRQSISAGSLAAAQSVVGELRSQVGACQLQWTALATWQAAGSAYHSQLAAYDSRLAAYRAKLATYRAKLAAYHASLAAYDAKKASAKPNQHVGPPPKNNVGARPKNNAGALPKDKAGAQPTTPSAASCAPASAFGVK